MSMQNDTQEMPAGFQEKYKMALRAQALAKELNTTTDNVNYLSLKMLWLYHQAIKNGMKVKVVDPANHNRIINLEDLDTED